GFCLSESGIFSDSEGQTGALLHPLSSSPGQVPLWHQLLTLTVIQMVFGYTVAITIMDVRRLTKEGYADNHLVGRIGSISIM
nr:probable arabinose 5-phosphate isomerase [Tanacetum cinerariifolium]